MAETQVDRSDGAAPPIPRGKYPKGFDPRRAPADERGGSLLDIAAILSAPVIPRSFTDALAGPDERKQSLASGAFNAVFGMAEPGYGASKVVRESGKAVAPRLGAAAPAGAKQLATRGTNLERMIAEGGDFSRVPKAKRVADEIANPSAVGRERLGSPTTFRTARGSSYVVDDSGRTTRNKAARPEHPGDSGPQPISQRTVYVEDPSALGEFQASGPHRKRVVVDDRGGFIGVGYESGPSAGKVERRTATKFSLEPRVGLTPVELWDNGRRAHFGNPIVEVSGGPAVGRERPGFLQTTEERIGRGTSTVARPAEGLGGTGGSAPARPGGPKFSGEQYPRDVQGDLNVIQSGTDRPTISFAEQERLADSLADTPLARIIDDLQKVGPGRVSGHVLEANRRVAGLLQESRTYRERMASGVATDADRLKFVVNIKQAVLGRAAAVGATSEGARVTGASGKIPIRSVLGKHEQAIQDAIDAAVKKNPGHIDEVAAEVSALADDPKKLAAYIQKMGDQPSFWDKFFEYYRANVLWGPATHVVNTTSGVVQVAAYASRELVKDPRNVKHLPSLGAGYLRAAAGLLPERTQQWLSSHMGLFDDLPNQLFLSSASDKYGGILHPRGAIGGPAGGVVRTPYKLLQVEDLFQTKPIFNFALKIHAERAGRARGLKGRALKDFVNNLPEAEFNEIAEAAMKDAQEFALHSSGTAAEAILKFREASPLIKAQIMFVTTPINLAKIGMRFSPLGGLRALPAAIPGSAGASARARLGDIAAETVIGSSVMAGFLALMAGDNMTGLRPKSEAERVLWEAEGRQPMSIRASEYPLLGPLFKAIYGDKAPSTWVTANYLGPLVYSGLIAGAVNEYVNEGGELTFDHAAEAAANAGNTMLNTIPLFQSYNGLKDLLANPNAENVQRFAANLLRPTLPAVSLDQMVVRLTDGFRRDPKTLGEVIKTTLPGLSSSVRLDYDVLGRPIEYPTGAGAALARATQENPSPVLEEARRLRSLNPNFIGLNKPGKSVGSGTTKIDLDPDTYNLYERMAGQAKEQAILALIASPAYQGATLAEQSRMFEKEEAKAQRIALRGLGVTIAQNSTDPERIVMGLRLATSSGSNYEKAVALSSVPDRLVPEVIQQFESFRDQTDPTKDNYDLSVSEYLHGRELVDAYRKAPAFVIGDPSVWAAAFRAKEQLVELRRGKSADEIKRDPAILNFYATAANGWLRTLYEADGGKKTKYVHRSRLLIKQDKLWGRFDDEVEKEP